jgi:ElaB/YqjD/DUF883 family membrane-anchored ribosome-binding protein
MALFLLLLVALVILADLIIITALFLKADRTLHKVEMFCDTFDSVLNNVAATSDSRLDKLNEKLAEAEDHLRTISKNIYIMARRIIQEEE